MLADKNAMATLAVKDLARAQRFYEGTLGLKPGKAEMETVTYQTGNSAILVYRSDFAGTNRATAATWNVGGAIGAIVAKLDKAGVAFERYEMPGVRLEGNLHVAEAMKVAWFKDPDGNIIALVGE